MAVPELTHEEAHRLAREQTGDTWVARGFRVLMVIVARLVFGLRVSGAEHVPPSGALVFAPNHKSFFDGPFLVAASPRRMRAMGKAELFTGLSGRFILAIGGFPVRRGESDQIATETAALLLARGEAVAVFPEGTRVRDPNVLGVPKRGAVRLAMDAGCPIIPVAMTGLEKRRLPLPRRIQVAFGEPIAVAGLEATPESAADLLGDVVWPTVEAEYHRLRARPGLIAAGFAAVGVAVVIQRRRSR